MGYAQKAVLYSYVLWLFSGTEVKQECCTGCSYWNLGIVGESFLDGSATAKQLKRFTMIVRRMRKFFLFCAAKQTSEGAQRLLNRSGVKMIPNHKSTLAIILSHGIFTYVTHQNTASVLNHGSLESIGSFHEHYNCVPENARKIKTDNELHEQPRRSSPC